MSHVEPSAALFIVPAYNEAENLPRVFADLDAITERRHIVVVSDGSHDDTARVARREGVVCIEFPINLGVAGVLQAGFRYALRHGYLRAVQFDGDGQHLASEAAKILRVLDEYASDIAVGGRAGHGQWQTTGMRRFGNRLISIYLFLLTGQYFMDPTSGFRAYSRRAIETFAYEFPEEYPEVEALVLGRRLELAIRETPVEMRGRLGGRSTITLVGSAYFMVKVLLASTITKLRRY